MLSAMRKLLLIAGLAVLVALPASAQLTVSRTNVTAGVTLAWDVSTDPTVVSYNIYTGTASGTYTSVTNVVGINVNSVTFSPILRGTTFFYAATSVNNTGLESLYSVEVTWKSPSLPPPPALRVASGK